MDTKEEKPFFTFFKRADKKSNKIIIPNIAIQKWGKEFYLEIYADKMVLKPLEKPTERE